MWPYNCPQFSKACTEFSYESPINYAWNSVDRYICDTGKDFNDVRDILEVDFSLPSQHRTLKPRCLDVATTSKGVNNVVVTSF